jgi:hypothetical protein
MHILHGPPLRSQSAMRTLVDGTANRSRVRLPYPHLESIRFKCPCTPRHFPRVPVRLSHSE